MVTHIDSNTHFIAVVLNGKRAAIRHQMRLRLSRIRASLIVLLACFFTLPAHALQHNYKHTATSTDSVNLANQFRYYFENQKPLEIENILRSDTSGWQVSEQGTVNFLYDDRAVWLRFDVQADLPADMDFLLEIASPFIDRVEFYHIGYNQYQEPIVLNAGVDGDVFGVSKRMMKARFPIFPVALQSDSHQTFYLRIKSTGALLAPVSLWPKQTYILEEQTSLVFQSLLFGIMIVMVLYNFSIFVFLRETTYLLYVGYVFMSILYMATITGFGPKYIWGDSYWLVQNAITLFVALSFMAGGAFVRSFLSLKKNSPFFYRLSTRMIWAYGVCAGLAFILPEKWVMPILQPMGLLACTFVLWAGIHQWRQGSIWARYMVISWTVLVIGTCVFTLMVLGYLPRNPFTEYFQMVGFGIEVTLLSIALAARMNQDRMAKKMAMETALNLAHQVNLVNQEKLIMQQQTNQELETKVNRQTWQLQSTLDKLYEANDRLDKLSKTDQLTGMYNRRFFDEFFPKEFKQSQLLKRSIAIVVMDIDFFKTINDVHGHLVGDQCLEMVSKVIQSSCQRPSDRIVRYGGEEFVTVLPNTDGAGAERVAERIRRAVEKTEFIVQGKRIPLTISIGITCLVPTPESTPAHALGLADRALYQAKSAGRNCVKLA